MTVCRLPVFPSRCIPSSVQRPVPVHGLKAAKDIDVLDTPRIKNQLR